MVGHSCKAKSPVAFPTFSPPLDLALERHEHKGWLPSAKLKPTFTFLGRDFSIFNTFSWQNPYQKKMKVGFSFALASQPFNSSLFLGLERTHTS